MELTCATFAPAREGRLTYAQRRIVALLGQYNEPISYDEMAARLGVDRHTAIRAIRRLMLEHRVMKFDGRGRTPNRYILTDRLFYCTTPGYRPSPVMLSEQTRRRLVERWAQARGAEV